MTQPLLDVAADLIARRSLSVQPGETALLITDSDLEPEVRASLRTALERAGAEVRDLAISFETPNIAMELPDPSVTEGVGPVVAAVSRSLTYNRTLADLRSRGGRVLSMPRITRETLERVAESDFEGMLRCTQRLAEAFRHGPRLLELRSPSGTYLRIDIGGNPADPIDGVAGPGEIDQLPAGVVSVVGRGAEGEIVITGPISLAREFDAPVRLRIEDGSIVAIEGGEAAARLERIFARYDDPGVRHCPAEVGIGSNPSVVYRPTTAFVPEFARAAGMIHVGIGDDHLFPGGTVHAPLHGDFLLPDAEVWLDGQRLTVECGEPE